MPVFDQPSSTKRFRIHPGVIWAIVRKDFLDIWLNKSALAGLVFPIILSLIWLLIGNLVGGAKSALSIYNPGNSSLAQAVVQVFPGAQIVQAGSAAEVENAFGPNGSKIKSGFTVGLIIPPDFESSLRAGSLPSISLYLNGSMVNEQTQALLQGNMHNFARAMANPQPPVKINTIVINPPRTSNPGVILKMVYLPMALLASLMVGIKFIPQLLLEEKECKTLRMLLVSPASFSDILISKLLVVLVFQLATTAVVLAILGGFTGDMPLVVLYLFLGTIFSLSSGLLFGALFNSVQAATTVSGFVAFVYIISGIFVGQIGELMGNSPVRQIVRLIPTYYLAEGVVNATQYIGLWGVTCSISALCWVARWCFW